MEDAIRQLEEVKDCSDIEKIKLCFDRLIRVLKTVTSSCKTCSTHEKMASNSHQKQDNCEMCTKEPGRLYIDSIIKSILHNTPTAEFYDRIKDLFPLIKSPHIFSDELQSIYENPSLAVPTLMFMYEIINYFQIEYDDFYKKILSTITEENCCSDGYLLFVLNTLHRKFCKRIEFEELALILQRFSEMSVQVSSRSAAKVLYTMIIILRMYPSLFDIVDQLNHIYILLNSLEYIARIARRIFIEAANPEMRPAMVFLENFSFPDEE